MERTINDVSIKPKRRTEVASSGRILGRALVAMTIGCLIACTMTKLMDAIDVFPHGAASMAGDPLIEIMGMTIATTLGGGAPLLIAVLLERTARIDLGAIAWAVAGAAISVPIALWTIGTGNFSGGAVAATGVVGGLFAHVGSAIGFGRGTWRSWGWTLMACFVVMVIAVATWRALPVVVIDMP